MSAVVAKTSPTLKRKTLRAGCGRANCRGKSSEAKSTATALGNADKITDEDNTNSRLPSIRSAITWNWNRATSAVTGLERRVPSR